MKRNLRLDQKTIANNQEKQIQIYYSNENLRTQNYMNKTLITFKKSINFQNKKAF